MLHLLALPDEVLLLLCHWLGQGGQEEGMRAVARCRQTCRALHE